MRGFSTASGVATGILAVAGGTTMCGPLWHSMPRRHGKCWPRIAMHGAASNRHEVCGPIRGPPATRTAHARGGRRMDLTGVAMSPHGHSEDRIREFANL